MLLRELQPLVHTERASSATRKGPRQCPAIPVCSLPRELHEKVSRSTSVYNLQVFGNPQLLSRDILNRHIILSHKSPERKTRKRDTAEDHQDGAPSASDHIEHSHTRGPSFSLPKTHELAFHPSLEDLSIWDKIFRETAPQFAHQTNQRRAELIGIYFQKFHPHWPVLNRETFLHTPQPQQLVQAVLAAGLWLEGTAESRREANVQLSALVRGVRAVLVWPQEDQVLGIECFALTFF